MERPFGETQRVGACCTDNCLEVICPYADISRQWLDDMLEMMSRKKKPLLGGWDAGSDFWEPTVRAYQKARSSLRTASIAKDFKFIDRVPRVIQTPTNPILFSESSKESIQCYKLLLWVQRVSRIFTHDSLFVRSHPFFAQLMKIGSHRPMISSPGFWSLSYHLLPKGKRIFDRALRPLMAVFN
jgi:hypothetical protein